MKKEQYAKLIFNPFDMTDQDIHDQVNENSRLYNVFGGDEGIFGPDARNRSVSLKARMFRFILFLYDKNSPLWITHPDIVSRKKQAALEAGFDIIQQDKTLESLFALTDLFFAKSVTSFIRYQHSDELSALIANEQVLFDLQKGLMENMDEFKDDKQKIDHFKTKADLIDRQDKIISINNKYKFNIWQGDSQAEEKTLEIEYGRKTAPEQIAKIELKRILK